VQSSPLRIGLVLAALVATFAAPRSADAAITFRPCPQTNNFACARLAVPLDPSGVTPGAVTLAVRRHRAPIGEARTAIIALAGGPGQAAIPFAEDFAELLGPIAASRDLIVYDQRGTGESGALACKSFAHVSVATPPPAAITSCAAQLGNARAFYGTADSVADLEAIRQAGGYEKLVLYGTSYGTKVAEDYAQAHPERVEALVLDSVVGPGAPDPFNRSTFAAVPRVLREVCRRGACRHVTTNPARDLARVLSRVHDGRLRGRVVGPHGKTRSLHITAQKILGALLAGDFSGSLRAAIVSATRSAARGDDAPLARLLAMLPGEASEAEGEGIDIPLYYATSCEDEAFPWSPTARPAARLAQARAAARALGARAFAPFDANDAFALSDIPACAFWPPPSPSAAPSARPLPSVPTLILSGAYDMRTPTSGARELAATIPGSHLVVVPRAGHSVLGGEGASCAQSALQALFASRPVQGCKEGPVPARLKPELPPPLSLSAIAPQHGYSGLPGRTAHAVELTLADLARDLALTIETSSDPESLLSQQSLQVGGLRGGWVKLSGGGVSFRGYSFIPGMTVTGSLRPESADLRIAGAGVAAGTLRLGSHRSLVGTLGGRRVRLAASGDRATAIVGSDAAARHALDPDGSGRVGAAGGLLARRLERLLDA
jgi:pimeloyl-ACP methyl ester carboxylesterase